MASGMQKESLKFYFNFIKIPKIYITIYLRVYCTGPSPFQCVKQFAQFLHFYHEILQLTLRHCTLKRQDIVWLAMECLLLISLKYSHYV